MITTLIVHADPAVSQRFASVLAGDPEITLVGSVGTAADGNRLCEEHNPDVALYGADLPDAPDLQAVRQLRRHLPFVSVMVLSASATDEDLFAAIRVGAAAYLPTDTDAAELISQVRRVAEGEYVINEQLLDRPQAAARVLDQFRHAEPPARWDRPVLSPLTDDELRVLRLVSHGMSNAEIAAELGTSPRAVKNTVTAILRKLSTNRRAGGRWDRFAEDDDDPSAAGMPARPRPPRPSSGGHAVRPPGAEQDLI